MKESLESFARQLGADNRVDVQLQVSGAAAPRERKADKDLLLIAREAIRNAISHGHAQHIAVGLCFERSRVRLEVTDDGNGFEPDKARGPEEGHYGILGMRERVEQLGGEFRVQSTVGQGAKVTVLAPYHE